MKANRTITRENAMRVLYQIFLYKKNKIDYTTNGVIEEYMDINPAIENVMIQDSKRLPQVEQPLEFIRQAEIFLN